MFARETGLSGLFGLFFRVRSPVAALSAAALAAACSQPQAPAAPDTATASAPAAAETAAAPAATPASTPMTLTCQGPFRADMTEADIRTAFGDANVAAETINLVEGETAPGLVLFGADPTRRIEIIWDQEPGPRRIGFIRASMGATAWTGVSNLRVGSPLADVERANGGPFTLYGFGWDYGGNVSNWRGGRLDQPDGVLCATGVRLRAGAEDNEPALGDSEFASDSAAVRAARPEVSELTLSFTRPQVADAAAPVT